MTKPTDASRKFSNTPEQIFFIALFIYRLQTTRVQKDNKSTAYNYVREWVMYRKAMFCCLFVLHTYTSLLWNLHWHISVHAKFISYITLHRSILSSETKLNDDKLSETATRLLRPNIIVSYILDVYNRYLYQLFSPVAKE